MKGFKHCRLIGFGESKRIDGKRFIVQQDQHGVGMINPMAGATQERIIPDLDGTLWNAQTNDL